MKEFLTEIDVISKIEHENLVKLYGCCIEGDQRILVYNYLENNSLAQTLLGNYITLSFSLNFSLVFTSVLVYECNVFEIYVIIYTYIFIYI